MNEITFDVEAEFTYLDGLKYSDGCRPIHLIDGYYTTGLHKYMKISNNKAVGKIAFISPEAYPHSLWVGKEIELYGGTKKIGNAIILKIYNKLLEAEV